ncbi:type II toxin-antitoxin system Phd/YefM family antitoxin [Myxococcota bacterium]
MLRRSHMQASAAKFKATCLELMDRVATTGEVITITKRGKPVAKLTAAQRSEQAPRSVHGCMKGTILHSAPLEQLLSTGERWGVDDRE